MEVATWIAALTSLLFTLASAWMVPALLMARWGILISGTRQSAKIDQIRKHTKGSSALLLNNKPHGLFVQLSPLAVGYISTTTSDYGDVHESAWIIGTKATYKKLTDDDPPEISADQPARMKLKLLDRHGNFNYIYWEKRRLEVDDFAPRRNQAPVLSAIAKALQHRPSGSLSILVTGPPGCGKTSLGVLLAQRLGGVLVDSFEPCLPGNSLEHLHRAAKPRADKPLVIVLNEADILIERARAGAVARHKSIPTQIYDKTSWNNLFDKFDLGLYPHTLLLLTANCPKADIDEPDPAFLRPGRTHAVFEMEQE